MVKLLDLTYADLTRSMLAHSLYGYCFGRCPILRLKWALCVVITHCISLYHGNTRLDACPGRTFLGIYRGKHDIFRDSAVFFVSCLDSDYLRDDLPRS